MGRVTRATANKEKKQKDDVVGGGGESSNNVSTTSTSKHVPNSKKTDNMGLNHAQSIHVLVCIKRFFYIL